MTAPVPWSALDDDLLRILARRGLSEGEIAEQMQRNKSSVRSRAAKIMVPIARDRNGMQKLTLARNCRVRGQGEKLIGS